MSEKTEKKKKKPRAEKRFERRFVPQSSFNPWAVRVLGAIGAAGLGAGAWAYFFGHVFADDDKLRAVPSYLIAGGAVLTGVAIWLGTSSEAPIRVGAPGIAMERGELRRMPWWSVEKISFDQSTLCLVVTGVDEASSAWSFKVPLKSHAEAVGWIVREALDRVPKVIDIGDDLLEQLPGASANAGVRVDLEPLQIVGKKCAVSGKTISYEPDGRVCTRCERVYLKTKVPKKCPCGANLAHLRSGGEKSDEEEAHEDQGAEG